MSDLIKQELTKFNFADAQAAEWQALYSGIVVADHTDKVNADNAHAARMVIRAKRVEVEKTRVALKADALAFGKAVDGEASRIKGLLEPLESYLQRQEEIVAKHKEREEAAAKAKADAERVELEAEAQRLRDQVAALEAEKLRAEQEKQRTAELEQARKEATEQAARETTAAIQLEQEAKELAARREQEAEAARLAAAPDRDKLHAYAAALLAVSKPEVTDSAASETLLAARQMLHDAVAILNSF
jgi:DNA repair exonuclease SbcCD ATPase subunit